MAVTAVIIGLIVTTIIVVVILKLQLTELKRERRKRK